MEVAILQVGADVLELPELGDAPLPEPFHALLEYAVLASEIDPHDPMEQAFQRLADTHLKDTEHLHPHWALAQEYELSPRMLAMPHLWHGPAGSADVVATKGAPEAIADLCHLAPAARAPLALQAEAMVYTLAVHVPIVGLSLMPVLFGMPLVQVPLPHGLTPGGVNDAVTSWEPSDDTGWRNMFSGLPAVAAWVLGATLVALLLVTMVPTLAASFRFAPLSFAQWLAAFGLGLAMVLPFH